MFCTLKSVSKLCLYCKFWAWSLLNPKHKVWTSIFGLIALCIQVWSLYVSSSVGAKHNEWMYQNVLQHLLSATWYSIFDIWIFKKTFCNYSCHKLNLSSDQTCMHNAMSPNSEVQTLYFGLKSLQAQNLHIKQSFDNRLWGRGSCFVPGIKALLMMQVLSLKTLKSKIQSLNI